MGKDTVKTEGQVETIQTEDKEVESQDTEQDIDPAVKAALEEKEKLKKSYDEFRRKYDKLKTDFDKAAQKIEELETSDMDEKQKAERERAKVLEELENKQKEMSQKEQELLNKELNIEFTKNLVDNSMSTRWTEVIDVNSKEQITEKMKLIKELIDVERKSVVKDKFTQAGAPQEGKPGIMDRPFAAFSKK